MRTSASRTRHLGTTIFAEMSELATRTGSINLGQGFPDADGPQWIADLATAAIREGRNQYAPGIGIAELRTAIAAHQERFYGLSLDPRTEVAVTTGATEAIAGALLGLVDPGDEVVVLEPYYDSYVAMIQMCGAVRRPVSLRAPDFRLDPDDLRRAISPRTRAILLNSPHNPTGKVLTRAELGAIAAVAIEHDLVVISDEVYEHLTFDDVEHIPIATLPGMRDRTLTISSAGKTFSFTGWKIGWATGPAPLVAAVIAVKQFLTFTSGTPFQYAIAAALGQPRADYEVFASALQDRRDQLCDGLADIGFTVYRPGGTYFATTDVSPLGFTDGLDFCRNLPQLAGVVAIPHQVFYDDPATARTLVRWAFCKRPEILDEALARLQSLG